MSQDYMCEQGEESSACIDSDATEGFPFPVYSSASTPQNQSLPSLLLCSLTSDITGDVPHHHLTLSVQELTYSSN